MARHNAEGIIAMEIHVNDDDPYSKIIKRFFTLEFPNIALQNAGDVLEGVMGALLASAQVRFGPKPNPESMVAIRDVVRGAIDKNTPIPLLMPWGGRKGAKGKRIDVAEVFALKQLLCLQERVSKFYEPGIRLRIRVEDASAHYVFDDEGHASRRQVEAYTRDFLTLIHVLDLHHFIDPIFESALFTEGALEAKADSIAPILFHYITLTDRYGLEDLDTESGQYASLLSMGWKGIIPMEQREYYRKRYRTMYPGITEQNATMKLARYFAQSWAKGQLNGLGADPAWEGKYVRLSFVNPIPGLPAALGARDVYYRTLPAKFTEYHMPPWRTKGYMLVTRDDEIVPKIAAWSSDNTYNENSMTLSNGLDSVAIDADYIVEDEK